MNLGPRRRSHDLQPQGQREAAGRHDHADGGQEHGDGQGDLSSNTNAHAHMPSLSSNTHPHPHTLSLKDEPSHKSVSKGAHARVPSLFLTLIPTLVLTLILTLVLPSFFLRSVKGGLLPRNDGEVHPPLGAPPGAQPAAAGVEQLDHPERQEAQAQGGEEEAEAEEVGGRWWEGGGGPSWASRPSRRAPCGPALAHTRFALIVFVMDL